MKFIIPTFKRHKKYSKIILDFFLSFSTHNVVNLWNNDIFTQPCQVICSSPLSKLTAHDSCVIKQDLNGIGALPVFGLSQKIAKHENSTQRARVDKGHFRPHFQNNSSHVT